MKNLIDLYIRLENIAKSNGLSIDDLKELSRSRSNHIDISIDDLYIIIDSIDFVIKEYSFTNYENLPWHVSNLAKEILNHEKNYKTIDGNFISSIEESFVDLMLQNKLEKERRYVGFAPCLKNVSIDFSNDKQFYKSELFSYSDYDYLIDFVNITKRFISDYCNVNEVKINDNQIDLFVNEIQVSSFNRRKYKDYVWVSGTLISLPRFSSALKLNE